MGLFSKKPKASTPQTPAPPPPPGAPAAAKAEPAPKPAKGKKYSVDPVDFLAMRSELQDLRARLEAAEQAKALVETRLAALDATTTAIAGERSGGDEMRARVNELHAQLDQVAHTASEAHVAAENAAAKAAAAATVASNNTQQGAAPAVAAPDPMLIARIDALAAQVHGAGATGGAVDPELAAKVDALAARIESAPTVDPTLAAKLDALAARVDAAPTVDPALAAKLDALAARVDAAPTVDPALAAKVDELAAKVQSAPATDNDTLARLEELAEKVAAVDSFGSQLAQLNARVTAQAEFGAQLGSLRDRIAELSNETDDRRAAALAATGDADLRDRVNAISDRLASTDGLAAQMALLAERVAANDTSARHVTEQVNAVEQRLNAVSTELANQVSELGRDIDGLAAQRDEVGNGSVSDELIDSLKGAQVRLAAEQARYEIAFRQDLATLAEQVQRNQRN